MKNVVRGFSPVHDPEGSHYNKEDVPRNDNKGNHRDRGFPLLLTPSRQGRENYF